MKRTTKQNLNEAFRELLQWEAKEQAFLALKAESRRRLLTSVEAHQLNSHRVRWDAYGNPYILQSEYYAQR